MKSFSGGTIHTTLPAEFREQLTAQNDVDTVWESLTPLARNEWLCWLTSPKKPETRAEHVTRAIEELREGKRRPCCWVGCIHRTDKAISPSVQGILNKTKKRQ